MADQTEETLKRLARVIRSEADDIEKSSRASNSGEWREARVKDRDYQRGLADGYRKSAELLDDGKGS